MPILAASSQVDITVSADSTLTIQNPGGFARVEYPVGTSIAARGGSSWSIDIPSGTCRLVTLTGNAFYEMTSDPVSVTLSASEVAATRSLVSGAGTFTSETYGATTGGSDATAGIQAAIDAASAAYNATTGARGIVWFQAGIYGITGLLLRPNVIYQFGAAYFKKLVNGTTVATNSMLRAVDAVLPGPTYYGNYDNIDIFGGTFDPNGFTCPAQILRFENVRDFRIEGTKVIHSAGCQSWAFQIGGQRVTCVDLQVRNGNLLFQDGIHITHGDRIEVRGGYVESGDDAIALGVDAAGTETWDDEALTNVTVNGTRVKAERGSIKIYYGLNTTTNQPFAGTNRGKVDGVVMTGLVGSLGRLSNGAIYITDTQTLTFTVTPTAATSGTLNANWTGASGVYNLRFSTASGAAIRAVTLTNGAATATWTGAVTANSATVNAGDASRLQNIQITNFDLTSGSAANDGLNANGMFVLYASNVKVHGTLRIVDTSSGARNALAQCTQLLGGDISIQCPALPLGPGFALFDCLDVDIHDSKLVGGGGSGRGSIEVTGSRNTKVHHNDFVGIPTNGAAIIVQGVGSGNYANTLSVDHNTAARAPLAATTRFLITQGSGVGFLAHLACVGNDIRGQAAATAIDQIFNTTGMNPDSFYAAGNRGTVVNTLAFGAVALAYAATLTPPLLNQTGQRMQTTLTGASLVALPAITLAGIRMVFEFTQDATGGRAVTWNAGYKGVTLAASGTANQKASIEFECDGTNWLQKSVTAWYS